MKLSIEEIQKVCSKENSVGRGGSRQVFALSNEIVIKIPHQPYSCGYADQSIIENEFYNDLETSYPEYKDLFCRRLASVDVPVSEKEAGYINNPYVPILIMERVTPLNSDSLGQMIYEWYDINIGDIFHLWYGEEEGNYEFERILEAINTFGIGDVSGHLPNWGVTTEGRIVIIDCGIIGYGSSFAWQSYADYTSFVDFNQEVIC